MNIEPKQVLLVQLADIQKSFQQIQNDNKMSLEEILGKRVQIQSTSILNMYQLVTQQWQKKQKIIEELITLFMKQNLSHQHTASKIVELEQEISNKSQKDSEIKKAQQEKVEESQKQNQKYKEMLFQKQKTLQQMSAEVEELKTFCEKLETRLDSAQSKLFDQDQQGFKECKACQEYESLLQLLKKQHLQEKDNYQTIKQQQIIQLKKEKRSLQRRIQELLDQNKLSKVELQLAEMAIKDALSFKDASFSNRSEELNKSDEPFATKSHGQFLNGELECFSNIEQQPNQFITQKTSKQTCSNINFITSSCDKNPEQSFQLKLSSNDDQTTLPNPFRKKNGRELRRYNTEVLNNDLSDSFQSETKQTLTKIEKEKKTVALQCNLLKNVPKIIMFSRKQSMKKPQEQSQNMMKSSDSMRNKNKQRRQMSKSKISMTKSMICLSNNPEAIGQNSLNKLFTFLSSRIIKNRIKTK